MKQHEVSYSFSAPTFWFYIFVSCDLRDAAVRWLKLHTPNWTVINWWKYLLILFHSVDCIFRVCSFNHSNLRAIMKAFSFLAWVSRGKVEEQSDLQLWRTHFMIRETGIEIQDQFSTLLILISPWGMHPDRFNHELTLFIFCWQISIPRKLLEPIRLPRHV